VAQWSRIAPGRPAEPAPTATLEAAMTVEQETVRKAFTEEEALAIATVLGIDFAALGFDLDQFRMGLAVELEHGLRDPETNVTGSDPIVTGKIALAHLKEFPDYYTRLAVLEREADEYWSTRR
jgi:hypothetical protein